MTQSRSDSSAVTATTRFSVSLNGCKAQGWGRPAAAPAPRPTPPRPALRTPGRPRCPDACPFPDSPSPWSLAGHLSFLSLPEVSKRVPLVVSCQDAAPGVAAVPGKRFFHPFTPALGLSWGPCWLPAELKLKFNERRNGGGSRLGHSHRSWEGVGDRVISGPISTLPPLLGLLTLLSCLCTWSSGGLGCPCRPVAWGWLRDREKGGCRLRSRGRLRSVQNLLKS